MSTCSSLIFMGLALLGPIFAVLDRYGCLDDAEEMRWIWGRSCPKEKP